MEHLYIPILSLAEELHLPVLDLPNSFDIFNDSLYSHQIEPSDKGGEFISHFIGEVIQRHDFSSVSKVYVMETSGSRPGAISSTNNVKEKKWIISN
jgi:hypothetical protein